MKFWRFLVALVFGRQRVPLNQKLRQVISMDRGC